MMTRFAFSCILWVLLVTISGASQKSPPPLRGRVLFLGDSITYGGDHLFDFQLAYQRIFPEVGVQFVNLGLPSETVSGLSEEGHADGRFPRPVLRKRLARILTEVEPDVIFAAYGINCAIYQPFSEDRFQAYQKGLAQLQEAASARKTRLFFLTPWPYDAQAGGQPIPTDYNEVLQRYARWLLSKKADGWSVIDVHTPLVTALADARKSDPEVAFTRDGIHLNPRGSWEATKALAEPFAINILEKNHDNFVKSVIDLGLVASLPDYHAQKNAFATSRDEWLRRTRHLRPRTPGGPDDPKLQPSSQP